MNRMLARLEASFGPDHVLELTAPAEVLRYVVFKGSIAVDGISPVKGRDSRIETAGLLLEMLGRYHAIRPISVTQIASKMTSKISAYSSGINPWPKEAVFTFAAFWAVFHPYSRINRILILL